MGARADETGLPVPSSNLLDSGLATLNLPLRRGPRRAMFRKLPDCAVQGFAPICMDTRDPYTVECAFKKRLMRDVPSPDPGLLTRFKRFVEQYVAELPQARIMSFDEWLESTTYNTARKDQLRSAYHDLRGGRPSRKQASHIDTFVKSEFYTEWKHARMINSRHDSFKAWSGPMFKAIEDVVYQIPEFIKHVPVPDRPSKIERMVQAGRRYYATDFTAFESHFTPEVMDACELVLYRHCLGWSADANFLCSVISGQNRMRTRTGVSATVEGRRMSGDMCTSLGNGFTNLMLAKFMAHLHNGSIEGFVEGDDGIFATNFDLRADEYAKLGFTIKIEEHSDPRTASFCGMVFAEGGQIIKDPRKVMMGFGWTSSYLHAGEKIMMELLRAKALSASYEVPHCPIVGALARRALSVTRGYNARFTDPRHVVPLNYNVPDFQPTDDTRLLFARLYGVSVAAQLAAESAIARGDLGALQGLVPPTSDQACYTTRYVEVV